MQSDISKLLKQRGHEVTKEGDDSRILIPSRADLEIRESLKEVLYSLMRQDSFRRSLRDWAYGRIDKNPHVSAIESYVTLCNQFGSQLGQDSTDNQARYRDARKRLENLLPARRRWFGWTRVSCNSKRRLRERLAAVVCVVPLNPP